MKKFYILLLILIIFVIGKAEETYFPYLYKYNSDSLKVLLDSLETVDETNVRACAFWKDMWSSQCLWADAIEVRTDYIFNSSAPDLHNLSATDVYAACNAALEAWNSIVDYNDPLVSKIIFEEENYSNYYNSIWIVPVTAWDEYHDNYEAPAITYMCYQKINWGYGCENYSPYCLTYSNSTSDPQLIKNSLYKIIYVNASDYGKLSFTFVWEEPDPSATIKELDIQHIITHELGHVLGFGDDTSSVDNIETIMSQGSYWNRTIEQELRNTFELLYNVECTSPGLTMEKKNEK